MEKQRAGVYIRVSTEKQWDWVWLETQEKLINEFLENHKEKYSYDKSKHFFFDKESGAIKDRKWLNQLFNVAQKWEIDVIIVYRADRIYRKIWLLAEVIDNLWKWWVWFVWVNDNIRLEWKEWKAQMLFFWVFAELERDLIRDRTMEAKRTKASLGYYVWWWVPPLWYDFYNDWKWTLLKVNKDEKRLINKIFRLYTRDRKSLWEIRSILEIDKEQTKDDRLVEKNWKKTFKWVAWVWDRSVISSILWNELYIWKYYYWKYSHDKEKNTWKRIRIINPPEKVLTLECPKILDEPEMFLEAKILLGLNKKIKNNSNSYPFTWLVQCWVCWKSYIWYKSTSKKWNKEYYRCKWSMRRSELIERCHNFNISWIRLMDYVWGEIYKVFKDPEKYLKKLVNKEKKLNLAQQFEEELKNAELKKSKLWKKLEIYMEASFWEEDEIKKNAFTNLVEKTISEIKELDEFIKECAKKVDDNRNFVENIDNLIAIKSRYQENINDYSLDRKVELIRQFVEKIVINYDTGDFTVYFRFQNNDNWDDNNWWKWGWNKDNKPDLDKWDWHIAKISYKDEGIKKAVKKPKEKIDGVDNSTFKVIANLIFKDGFPHKKDLFEPFNMVQKGWFSNWWRWQANYSSVKILTPIINISRSYIYSANIRSIQNWRSSAWSTRFSWFLGIHPFSKIIRIITAVKVFSYILRNSKLKTIMSINIYPNRFCNRLC